MVVVSCSGATAREKQVATITEWLASLGLPEYAQRFAENGIDVSVLRYLTDQDLEKIGVLLGHRRKMLAAIAELSGAAPAMPQPASQPEEKRRHDAERRAVLFELVPEEAHLLARSTVEGERLQRHERLFACLREGKAEALMKGSLHTDELMGPVLARDTGIRTARRISHCFVMDVPGHKDPLIVTDAAVNIAPDLEAKVDIVQNAIDLGHALRFEEVRVAILSAMETVNPKVPSTVEAAALCKMADRGQITGGVLDGPLAFDTAVSAKAAKIKKLVSPVTGQADILVVPDLESGNMLAKQLVYLADAEMAGIVLGARVPIILTSRADSVRTRMASCAIAALYAHARRVAAANVGKLAE